MDYFPESVALIESSMLAGLLAVGIYTSYTDFAMRLVPNRYTLGLLAIGLAGQLLLVMLDAATLNHVVATVVVAFAIAVGLSMFSVWSPGDAKLFLAAAIALPPTFFPTSDPFSLEAPPTALVINAMLCYLLVLMLIPLWSKESESITDSGQSLSRDWIQSVLTLSALLGLSLSLGLLVLERGLSYVEAFGAVVIGGRLVDSCVAVRSRPVIVLPGLSALTYLVVVSGGLREYSLLLGAALIVEVVYWHAKKWFGRAYVQATSAQYLQPGAVPLHTLTVIQGDGRCPVCVEGEQEAGDLVCEAGKPLSSPQVTRLRSLGSEESLPNGKEIMVVQSLPFVPFITIAAAVTAIFSGSLIPPIAALVEWFRG